jgi:anti-sigma factor RsiW
MADMQCRQIDCRHLDELLCDYIDGTLAPETTAMVDTHLAACARCAEELADARMAVNFLGTVADVEPPKELITRILYHTPQPTPLLSVVNAQGWLRRWLAPVLQPRFAMGMAMTILSFSMLGKFVAPVRQLKPSDLDPVKVWRNVDDSAHRTWDRFVKYYDNLKLVYEVQAAIEELRGSEEDNKNNNNENQRNSGGKK